VIEAGKPAPPFELTDQNDASVRLRDFAGKWVILYFYPRDDTPGCTTEACDFTAAHKAFARLDAVVLGCSPDPPETHRDFAAKYNLTHTLLSDPRHTTMERYGAWGEKKMYGRTSQGVIRSTVLIDPEGKIAHHWRRVQAKGHAEKVRARLEELRATAR